MPSDAPPSLTDWANPSPTRPLYHEDAEDFLGTDGTWGPMNPGTTGGSGIVMGYACDDLAAVLCAEDAVFKRTVRYDLEHWIRQIRYALTAWEQTHVPKYARRIVYYDSLATGAMTTDPATIHLNDPGWIPDTLAQYHQMAAITPHAGLRWNCRATGWVAYGRAMRHKVDRLVTPAWADMFLETTGLAAVPGTGQQGSYLDTGVTYTFHEAILIHGTLALCHRLHRSIPYWVFELMDTIERLPRMDYYGTQSPISYWRTVDGVAVPVDQVEGTPQHGDPFAGFWSSNCIAMWHLTGDATWKRKATLIGPTTAANENSRQSSMVWRGAQ